MILEILRHTPAWVYVLFAYLVWIGVKRLQASVRDVRRVGIVPVVFIVWGLSGLVQRIDTLPLAGAHWLIGAIVGCGAGLMLKQSLLADRAHLRVLQSASVVPLLRNLAIFGLHYLLNVAAAIHPRDSASYMDLDIYVSGISAGYFIGWGIRFMLAYRNAPQTDLGGGTSLFERLHDGAAHSAGGGSSDMKAFIVCLLVLGTLFLAPARAADLDVTVTDVRVSKGTLMIALVDSALAWDDQAKAIAGASRKVPGKQESFHFANLAPGAYAVKVMHDENDNGTLDVNFAGMPIEGYGFSNDPQVLRKPTFDEARFELGAGGGAITIHLR